MSYKQTIEELIQFVDAEFKDHSRRDEILSDRKLLPMLIMLGISTVYVVSQMFVLSITQWLPLAIALTALLIAGTSTQDGMHQKMKRYLLIKEYKRLWSICTNKCEEKRHLLLPLVAMKKENRRMNLSTLYKMNEAMFEKDNLLKFYLVH